MTREEKIKAFTMRLDGMTLQDIGEALGTTKQNIDRMLKASISGEFKERSVYPNLNAWMIANEKRSVDISMMLNIVPSTTRNKLTGVTQFKLNEIEKLVEATGIESAILFSRRGKV